MSRKGDFGKRELQTWMNAEMDNDSANDLREVIWELASDLEQDPEFLIEIDRCRNDLKASDPDKTVSKLLSPFRLMFATATIMLVLGTLFLYQSGTMSRHFVTEVGEQRFVTLEDGSTVSINTDTDLTVRYSGNNRQISMQRGEAIFNVATDPYRPFEVVASNGVTRATGTVFSVAVDEERVSVSVLEGAVEVETETESGVVKLSVGDAVNYLAEGVVTPVHEANIRRIRAWEEKKLFFEDTLLEEMVAEYNRYSKTRLVLANNDQKNLKVSGVFRIGNLDSLLFTLEEVFNITHIHQPGQVILIRQSDPIMSAPKGRVPSKT